MDRPKGRYSHLLTSAMYLTVLQVFTYLFPLILFAFLGRTLGATHLGIYALGTAVVQAGAMMADFGLSLFGSYTIARRNSNIQFVRKFIASGMIIKLSILGIMLLPYIFAATSQNKYPGYSTYFLLLLLPLTSEVISPLWIFQGLEKFKYITIVSIVSRLGFVSSVVILVRNADSFWKIPVILALFQTLAALVLWRWLYRSGFSLGTVSTRLTVAILKSSFGFFLSRLSVATYTTAGPIFLGITQTAPQVATFSVAQQLYKAAQTVVGTASQVLYPFMARKRDFRLLFGITALTGLAGLAGIGLVALFGSWAISAIFGPGYAASEPVLRVFFIAFAFHSVSVLIGYPLFAALGRPQVANRTLIAGGMLQLGILGALWLNGSAAPISVAYSILAVEVTVLVVRTMAAFRYGFTNREGGGG